jgi:hypothetical protein
MANIVKRENDRTYEQIILGALKVEANGTVAAPGAATASPTGEIGMTGVQLAVQQTGSNNAYPLTQVYGYLITGISSFTGIFIGSKVDDAGGKKAFPVANGAEVIAINEAAKTVMVNVAPVRSIVEPIEQSTTKTAAEKKTELTETVKFTNFTELGISSGALTAGALPTLSVFPLVSPAYQFADNVAVTVNVLEGTATSALAEVFLYTSFDGGTTWVEAGKTASLAITEKGAAVGTISLKEKLQGQRFALAVKVATAANKAAGIITVACDRTSTTAIRNV